MDTSDLGKRMKEYEDANKVYLTRRIPVMIRVDGRAFHTYTKGFERPFDEILTKAMQMTMKYLCENIPGCVLGYTQSDEISLLLIDYRTRNSGAWYNYVRRKVETAAASMATMAFNQVFSELVMMRSLTELAKCTNSTEYLTVSEKYDKYMRRAGWASFDARAFNIPEFEVENEFIWRQSDCVRNSIQSVGHANFTEKELDHKNMNMIQDMLMTQRGINWNDFPVHLKRGSCCIKVPKVFNEGTEEEFTRNKWTIDENIPIFTQNRSYISNCIVVEQ